MTASQRGRGPALRGHRGEHPNPTNEALWAAPGTMVGALHMLERTGGAALARPRPRQRRAALAHLAGAASTRPATCGRRTCTVTSCSTSAPATASPATSTRCCAVRLCSIPRERDALYERCVETLRATAMVQDGCANWPPESPSLTEEDARPVVSRRAGHHHLAAPTPSCPRRCPPCCWRRGAVDCRRRPDDQGRLAVPRHRRQRRGAALRSTAAPATRSGSTTRARSRWSPSSKASGCARPVRSPPLHAVDRRRGSRRVPVALPRRVGRPAQPGRPRLARGKTRPAVNLRQEPIPGAVVSWTGCRPCIRCPSAGAIRVRASRRRKGMQMDGTIAKRDAHGVEAAPTAILEAIGRFLAGLHPGVPRIRPVTLDSSLDRDLGLDSLSRVELAVHLERTFGVRLSETGAGRGRQRARPALGASRVVASNLRSRAGLRFPRAGPSRRSPRPTDAATLIEVLDWHAGTHPDRVQVVHLDDGHETGITYGDLLRQSDRIAGALQRKGLERGRSGGDHAAHLPRVFLRPTSASCWPAASRCRSIRRRACRQIEDHVRRHAGILANAGAGILVTVPEATPRGEAARGARGRALRGS